MSERFKSLSGFSSERAVPMTRRRVVILVFPEVEVLDFCGPFKGDGSLLKSDGSGGSDYDYDKLHDL